MLHPVASCPQYADDEALPEERAFEILDYMMGGRLLAVIRDVFPPTSGSGRWGCGAIVLLATLLLEEFLRLDLSQGGVIWRGDDDGRTTRTTRFRFGVRCIGVVPVEHPDAAFFPDAVGHLVGVNPEREFPWKYVQEVFFRETNGGTSESDERIHFVINNSDASVAAAFEWLLWEPVVLVVVDKRVLEHLLEAVHTTTVHVRVGQDLYQETNC